MLVEQRQSRLWFKANGLIRTMMARGLPLLGQPKVVLTEYPKSGGTWIGQMLSDCLRIDNPRNRIPPRQRCLLHGVHMRVSGRHDTVVLWRDGRDIMVSFYFHLLFDKPLNGYWQAEELTQKLGIGDIHDVQTYLPRFIEHCFNGGYPRFPWNDFFITWNGRTDCHHTSYEGMTDDPQRELSRLVTGITGKTPTPHLVDEAIQNNAFENIAKRKRGEEDPTNFVRKGIPGDWREKFTAEARQVFDYYAGDVLIGLGYEPDRRWVDNPDVSITRAPTLPGADTYGPRAELQSGSPHGLTFG